MKIGFELEKVGIIKMANTGNATLTISGITISGAFTQTNNCGLSLAAGVNCVVSIRFTPTVTGIRVSRAISFWRQAWCRYLLSYDRSV
jgi:hypothetical protein